MYVIVFFNAFIVFLLMVEDNVADKINITNSVRRGEKKKRGGGNWNVAEILGGGYFFKGSF